MDNTVPKKDQPIYKPKPIAEPFLCWSPEEAEKAEEDNVALMGVESPSAQPTASKKKTKCNSTMSTNKTSKFPKPKPRVKKILHKIKTERMSKPGSVNSPSVIKAKSPSYKIPKKNLYLRKKKVFQMQNFEKGYYHTNNN